MTTIRQAARSTLEHRWAQQRSIADSRRNIDACIQYIGQHKPLSTVTTPVIRKMIQYMQGTGVSNATINRRLAALSAVLKDAHRDGYLEVVPWVPKLPESRGRERVLSESEVEDICRLLPKSYKQLTIFLVNTGARVGEALKLKWEDVDACAYVTFRDTKNGTNRRVPLNPRAARVIEELRENTKFRGPFALCRQSTYNMHFAAAREFLGFRPAKECVPHSLRHTFASRLVAQDVPLEIVSRLLGHSSLQMTMRYAHSNMDSLTAAVEKL